MSFEIQKLTPNNQEDFFSLFENPNFKHQESWRGCYCRFYHTTCSYEEWNRRSPQVNRADAMNAIASNEMHGFLAYEYGECVGWLNASSVLNYSRILKGLPARYQSSQNVLAICYVIRESHRHRKVSSALLDHAIKFYFGQGFLRIIALPVEREIPEENYRGFKQMYLNRGFVEESDGILVLKNPEEQ